MKDPQLPKTPLVSSLQAPFPVIKVTTHSLGTFVSPHAHKTKPNSLPKTTETSKWI